MGLNFRRRHSPRLPRRLALGVTHHPPPLTAQYHKRRFKHAELSPTKGDAFAGSTPARSYAESMALKEVAREKASLTRKIQKQEEETERMLAAAKDRAAAAAAAAASSALPHASGVGAGAAGGPTGGRKRRRWDSAAPSASSGSVGGDPDATPIMGAGADATPVMGAGAGRWGETPVNAAESWTSSAAGATPVGSAAATPLAGAAAGFGVTPAPGRKRSRWDATPVDAGAGSGAGGAAPTPLLAAASAQAAAVAAGLTPSGRGVGATPLGSMTPVLAKAVRAEAEMAARNAYLTDAELDEMMPVEGYDILDPPASYVPIRTPARKLLTTPAPLGADGGGGFTMQEGGGATLEQVGLTKELHGDVAEVLGISDLPPMRPEDAQFFGALLEPVPLSEDGETPDLTKQELAERRIMALLLKVKNGMPHQRKQGMRALTRGARDFGASALFNQLLPLMLSPALEDQERHTLVKLIDRIIFQLDDAVRPHVKNILRVVEPMLIDEDYYARVEAREIISNVAKAAGLATMISVMRPDIDDADEYVRNCTARAFAVVASALGIPAILPFLKAVAQSTRSWEARHTGVKIVQRIAILQGCAVLPHLKHMVDIIGHGLSDPSTKVQAITAHAIAALGEAAYPYGIEAFDSVLQALWRGVKNHSGKTLSAYLKANGAIIPLMDAEYAASLTRVVMPSLIRQFSNPDSEIKRTVLKVVQQCVGTEGVEVDYVMAEVLPEFFRCFWVRRTALDRRDAAALVATTVEVATKVGLAPVLERIVGDLKDEAEAYRVMVMDAVQQCVANLGAGDIGPRLEERLVDGIVFAFQEQAGDTGAGTILDGFGTVVRALGVRSKPYLTQFAGSIKWRLGNTSSKVRMLAADLTARIAGVFVACGEETHLTHLGVVLYESLGEEYPEVLGSILRGLTAIVSVVGMAAMQPPVADLLPRLTPILKNRHEKVMGACIQLVGRIADRGSEFVSALEWMRICYDLLELLKADKKSIRRATVNTFGFIAKAVGPQDVMHVLLNNLRVQERTLRVCTTVAIAIVAETCQPFTVLPALMNEYRIPDLNVQNGVLKALSFLFQYIGEMGKDYVYSLLSLLEDALTERDLVHRQIACNVVFHAALGVAGLGCEDAMVHLLNFVWPNAFEQAPHFKKCVFEAVEGIRVAVGGGRILQYVLQGLFHPARRVREVYWKLYNNLYVYAADQLTPFYPRLEPDVSSAAAAEAIVAATSGPEGHLAAKQVLQEAAIVNDYRRTWMEVIV